MQDYEGDQAAWIDMATDNGSFGTSVGSTASQYFLQNNKQSIVTISYNNNNYSTAYNVFQLLNSPAGSNGYMFTIDNYGKITSKNLSGVGEATLIAQADGTIARGIAGKSIRKNAIIATSTEDQPASVSYTFAQLGISNTNNIANRIKNVTVVATNPADASVFARWDGFMLTSTGATFYLIQGASLGTIPANSPTININIYMEIEGA